MSLVGLDEAKLGLMQGIEIDPSSRGAPKAALQRRTGPVDSKIDAWPGDGLQQAPSGLAQKNARGPLLPPSGKIDPGLGGKADLGMGLENRRKVTLGHAEPVIGGCVEMGEAGIDRGRQERVAGSPAADFTCSLCQT